MEQNRLSQLLAFLQQAPEDSFSLYSVAYEYARQGDDLRAKHYFEQLLALHPDYLGAYYQYGQILERLNNPDEAQGVYEKGLIVAKKQGDQHSLEELQRALAQLQGVEEEEDPYWDEV